MSEYWRRDEGLLQGVEGPLAPRIENKRNTLAGQTSERNDDVGIVRNEAPIKVSEPEEGLNVLDLPRFGPTFNYLNLGGVHFESLGQEDVPKILDSIFMELALFGLGEKLVLAKTSEYFANVFGVLLRIVGVD